MDDLTETKASILLYVWYIPSGGIENLKMCLFATDCFISVLKYHDKSVKEY